MIINYIIYIFQKKCYFHPIKYKAYIIERITKAMAFQDKNTEEVQNYQADSSSSSNKIAIYLASIPDIIYIISYGAALLGFLILCHNSYKAGYFSSTPIVLLIGEMIMGIIATGFAGMLLTMTLGLIHRIIKSIFT